MHHHTDASSQPNSPHSPLSIPHSPVPHPPNPSPRIPRASSQPNVSPLQRHSSTSIRSLGFQFRWMDSKLNFPSPSRHRLLLLVPQNMTARTMWWDSIWNGSSRTVCTYRVAVLTLRSPAWFALYHSQSHSLSSCSLTTSFQLLPSHFHPNNHHPSFTAVVQHPNKPTSHCFIPTFAIRYLPTCPPSLHPSDWKS